MSGTDIACFAMRRADMTHCLNELAKVGSAISIRACYAMSGTVLVYAAAISLGACYAISGLRACYAMSGTDIAYGLRAFHATSGTDAAQWYGATCQSACNAMPSTHMYQPTRVLREV
eukprot:1315814-Rhodomonas_salina.1